MRPDRTCTRAAAPRPTAQWRWLSIIIRTAHIGFAAVFFGGCVLHVASAQLGFWPHGTLATGTALLLLEWRHDLHWPHRGKGLLVILHVGLVLLIPLHPGLTVPLLWGALVSGCIGSHMPRRFRHWSLLQGPEVRPTSDQTSDDAPGRSQ